MLIETSTELRAFDFEEFMTTNDERFDGQLEAIPCETSDSVVMVIPSSLCDKDMDDAIFLFDNVASMD